MRQASERKSAHHRGPPTSNDRGASSLSSNDGRAIGRYVLPTVAGTTTDNIPKTVARKARVITEAESPKGAQPGHGDRQVRSPPSVTERHARASNLRGHPKGSRKQVRSKSSRHHEAVARPRGNIRGSGKSNRSNCPQGMNEPPRSKRRCRRRY